MQLPAEDPILVQNYISGDEKALEILINKQSLANKQRNSQHPPR